MLFQLAGSLESALTGAGELAGDLGFHYLLAFPGVGAQLSQLKRFISSGARTSLVRAMSNFGVFEHRVEPRVRESFLFLDSDGIGSWQITRKPRTVLVTPVERIDLSDFRRAIAESLAMRLKLELVEQPNILGQIGTGRVLLGGGGVEERDSTKWTTAAIRRSALITNRSDPWGLAILGLSAVAECSLTDVLGAVRRDFEQVNASRQLVHEFDRRFEKYQAMKIAYANP
jgi:hypothetical protein